MLAKHVADGDPLSYYLSLDEEEAVVDFGHRSYRLPGVYAPE